MRKEWRDTLTHSRGKLPADLDSCEEGSADQVERIVLREGEVSVPMEITVIRVGE
jgi:hypothetical protein